MYVLRNRINRKLGSLKHNGSNENGELLQNYFYPATEPPDGVFSN
jgi:hypothetical protein